MLLALFSILLCCPRKPKKDSQRVGKHVEKLFNEYYEGKEDIKQHSGVKYIEYNKYYDEENEESLIDEVLKIEKFLKSILMFIIMILQL